MTISSEIISVLDAICEKFGVVIDWSQQNIFPYLQELSTKIVNYELCTSLIWLFFGLSSIIALIVFTIAQTKNKKRDFKTAFINERRSDVNGLGCVWIGFAVLALLGFLIVLAQAFDIVTCLTFPEKIIFDFLKSNQLI